MKFIKIILKLSKKGTLKEINFTKIKVKIKEFDGNK